MLLVADVHLGIRNDDDVFLNQSRKLFDIIIEDCIRRDTNDLVILGDFFDNRKSINLKTLNVAIDIVDNLKKENIDVYFIIGNHDTYYKTEIETNSIRIFKEYKNVTIVNEPLIMDKIGMVSWNQEIDTPVEYLIGHFEINGFPVTEKIIFEKSKLYPSDFKQYKKVISGHFHIPSTKDNITYLGAPYQLTFNDCGGIRGYYSFEDGKLEFIEFPCVKFVNIQSDKEIKEEDVKGNIVKLTLKEDLGTVENQKIIDRVQSYEPLRFFPHFDIYKNNNEIKNESENNIEIKSNKEILFDFIKLSDNPDFIDPKVIMNIVDELLGE